MGIQLGGIGALAPQRRPALARVVLRALIAGTMACFMTACIAGGYLKIVSFITQNVKLWKVRDYFNEKLIKDWESICR